MADIRIKDLTTTASSTASDDFFAVDGTTNGTRKLNAYSPSFGGNATVTGTLTVNSTSTLTGATVIGGDSSNGNYLSYNTDISGFCGLWMRQSTKSATNYVLASNGTSGTLVNSTGASLFLRVENTTALEINTSRNVLIPTTTASTSTSTGALVVSGGVGVAGGSWFGADLVTVGTLWNSGTSNVTTNGFNDATTIASNVITIYGSTGSNNIQKAGKITTFDGGSGYYGLNLQVPTSAYPDFSGTVNFTNALTLTSQQIKINPTTASTSTSSGALVVSGGVGVAKELYIGGLIESSDAAGIRVRTASGTAAKLSVIQTGNATWEMQSIASSSDFAITANSTTDAFRVTTAGNATLAGSVKTSAPSGGTAAAWKLGTVASVSPTSPNRTIEVDIGGTIYYLHAKTTNN